MTASADGHVPMVRSALEPHDDSGAEPFGGMIEQGSVEGVERAGGRLVDDRGAPHDVAGEGGHDRSGGPCRRRRRAPRSSRRRRPRRRRRSHRRPRRRSPQAGNAAARSSPGMVGGAGGISVCCSVRPSSSAARLGGLCLLLGPAQLLARSARRSVASKIAVRTTSGRPSASRSSTDVHEHRTAASRRRTTMLEGDLAAVPCIRSIGAKWVSW